MTAGTIGCLEQRPQLIDVARSVHSCFLLRLREKTLNLASPYIHWKAVLLPGPPSRYTTKIVALPRGIYLNPMHSAT